ncbi:hypothetical protein GCM10009718_29000 [Isoptericola halotolerans]|uniref:VapC50 C-terminal domain-containing protein n=1 Tax=Isoptericola halotolerans TaxID=300560 RepID=A0ABX2A4Q1_9MICO|nr:hypothetical protein [Isoptericola halotolerans]
MFTALLDTSVLWPSLQRDVLLSMAAEGLYRPIWSTAVLQELTWAEEAKRVRRGATPKKAHAAAEWLVTQMTQAFDDSCVQGWEPLVGSYGLPDPDDEHLVAAAVVGGAGVIVSSNLKDLPEDRLPEGIGAVSAARFAADTVSVSPGFALRALENIAQRYQNPARTVRELVATLEARYDMTDAATLLVAALEREEDRHG